MQSTVFTHFRKTIKLTDHLDKNEEDNTDALSDHDYLCNDIAEENNELNYCFEEIHSFDQLVEPEDDSNGGPENTGQKEKSQWTSATTGRKISAKK